MELFSNIKYVGVNDHITDLFESQFAIPHGMAYNSYIIIDEKIAVMDTVEIKFGDEWINNIKKALGERTPDYLVIQHMEPDHSANIDRFLKEFPEAKIVGNAKTFGMIKNFFPDMKTEDKEVVVTDKYTLSLGSDELTFIFAPMVHWPEVMLTYEKNNKVIFSADAFGKFGANDYEDNWTDEARRFYYGIVAKYGMQVQILLKKLGEYDIQMICPLHGKMLKDNLGYYLDLYDKWSKCLAEKDGVIILYTSVYGNTKKAVRLLEEEFEKNNTPYVSYDVSRTEMSECVAKCYMYQKIVLATTTYNMDIFPTMKEFINHLVDRNFGDRTFGFIENGSWAPNAIKVMKKMLENQKGIIFTENNVTIKSALSQNNYSEIALLANELK